MSKKPFLLLIATLMLAGCAIPSNTIIDISPKITLPQRDPSLLGITISINGTDKRKNQELSKVTRNNQLVTLIAYRDLRFLLQEVLEKQMTARGYIIGSNSEVDLQIILNNLYVDVSQGNTSHSILSRADITIIATSIKGKRMIKNYRASCFSKGIFQATNKNIADTVNSMLTDIIADMSQDTCIHYFIKQNAH